MQEKVQSEIGLQMTRHYLIRTLWIVACIIVLVWWLYSYGLKEDLAQVLKSESQIYLLIAMVILTFPLGIPWIYLFSGLQYVLESVGIDMSGKMQADVFLLWLGFVVIGYIQWFVIVPYLIRKMRERALTKDRATPVQ